MGIEWDMGFGMGVVEKSSRGVHFALVIGPQVLLTLPWRRSPLDYHLMMYC